MPPRIDPPLTSHLCFCRLAEFERVCMKHDVNFRRFTGLLLILPAIQIFAQDNLIDNGDFADTSGWNPLGLYNEGQATGVIENGTYKITITNPGTEVWAVQFTQNHIALDRGTAYTFSYEISASINRTVEVSLSRDGNDYLSYSGRDTVRLTPQGTKIEKNFVMKQPTDTNVRLEFNCGMATGAITIKNVQLVKNTAKILTVEKPSAGELVYADIPYTIVWSSLNIDSTLSVNVSVDNGTNWKKVGTARVDSGSYIWIPERDYSPWCRIKLTSDINGEVSALNDGAFELAPSIDLIKNGNFDNGDRNWFFGKYAGTATGEVTTGGEYHFAIDTKASEPWQIQLTQSGISLIQGADYRLTFIAYATETTEIMVNVGMDYEPFSSYFDTTKSTLALTSSPQLFDFEFTMNAVTDTGARIEFNCGKAQTDIFIDQISLTRNYIAAAETRSTSVHRTLPVDSRVYVIPGKTLLGTQTRLLEKNHFYGNCIVNLLGRHTGTTGDADRSGYSDAIRAAGVYLMHSIRVRGNDKK
jgi:hypothetical protein